MLRRHVKYFSGVNMSDNYYRQFDHSHGPPRTARTNLWGRATTCMRYILSQLHELVNTKGTTIRPCLVVTN